MAIVALIALCSNSGFAQEPTKPGEVEKVFVPNNVAPGLLRYAYLMVSNYTEGNCFKSDEAVKSRLTQLLEQNEIVVLERHPWFYGPTVESVRVHLSGSRGDDGLCDVRAIFAVGASLNAHYRSSTGKLEFVLIRFGGLHYQSATFESETDVNKQVRDFIEAAALEFLSDVSSARRDPIAKQFRKAFPPLSPNKP